MLRCCEGAVASGPSSGGRRQSLGGEALATPRHLPDISHRQSWREWEFIVDAYGPVTKLQGLLGVSFVLSCYTL